MSKEFDAVIAGAGPAGSSAAYKLAEAGLSVLIIDREKFPRYKTCAAGITFKDISLIPFDVSEVIEKEIKTVSFSRNFATIFERHSELPLMYCTMRSTFDHLLLKKAVEKGAVSVENEKVTGFETDKDIITVRTDKNSYRCRTLIGAEGPNSPTAKCAGLMKKRSGESGIALEAELGVDAGSFERFKDKVHMDAGTIPGGYAWIFPKKEHLSIGAGGPVKLAKHIETYFKSFIDGLGIKITEIMQYRFHSLPVKSPQDKTGEGPVLLAGDAAGMTDPLSGEGIFYAVKSGQNAAECVVGFIEGKIKNPGNEYTKRIKSEFNEELKSALDLRRIFNTFPGFCHKLVRENERSWNSVVKLMRGEKKYSDYKNHVLLKPLWNTMIRICAKTEAKKIKRFKPEKINNVS